MGATIPLYKNSIEVAAPNHALYLTDGIPILIMFKSLSRQRTLCQCVRYQEWTAFVATCIPRRHHHPPLLQLLRGGNLRIGLRPGPGSRGRPRALRLRLSHSDHDMSIGLQSLQPALTTSLVVIMGDGWDGKLSMIIADRRSHQYRKA